MGSITIIEIIGTAAFSIAGTFAAMKKKLDIFGVFIIAFITALGGGTLRDVLIGEVPVLWMLNLNFGLIVLVSTIFGLFFKKNKNNFQKLLLLSDSIGVGFFTVVGIQTGISLGFHPIICVTLGTMTACFGGVIRDITLSSIPLIFEKEIYATTCIFGGAVFFILLKMGVPKMPVEIICLISIVLFRLLAVKNQWQLPRIWKSESTT
ncbi:trimeric intracellular cation channel family protein [Kaistella yonginensis]|uniref:trimeric intracellular cation channel family protein n=1 Tax=Kaistella yonginensis TaxID=658267 RepID=UPI0025B5A206|nr:trimeric intracellular cation channel family protein [Kaistella yonginensis]MDN3607746.1 trimeric intracellular cation channel family protein [Kaistella yonginensis]